MPDTERPRPSRFRAAPAACAMVAVLTGCSGGFPADPDGTLETVTGGVLRVGVSSNPPWTETGAGGPTGLEPEARRGLRRVGRRRGRVDGGR